ncbi:MAG: Adenylate kinase [Candidatus Woesebacteria bacterium GW2011_GWA1_45_8]|uniref:Adenylate kinase n=1 Tax=Candidatus Woesebacteria bacterium GW2011_GWA1_45_8 TaxID=1618559 RepID=A0A0G1Q3Q4_9BACT|nr:MAG: Adenylate kinase [Candidatus Woesebacteria bacterium GW2011_GWA1_45_8]
MNIIILGPQGSGKGTQARLLSEKLGLFYVESGGLLRQIAKNDPAIDETMNKKGQLLPDDVTFGIVKNFLEANLPKPQNILLDGYPRSLRQYELIRDYLSQKGTKIDIAIFLDISDEEAVRRLSSRRICASCGEVYNMITNPPKNPEVCDKCGGKLIQREDDKPELIQERLRLYRGSTEPLVRELEKEEILVNVNGQQPIETIFGQILEKLNDV